MAAMDGGWLPSVAFTRSANAISKIRMDADFAPRNAIGAERPEPCKGRGLGADSAVFLRAAQKNAPCPLL